MRPKNAEITKKNTLLGSKEETKNLLPQNEDKEKITKSHNIEGLVTQFSQVICDLPLQFAIQVRANLWTMENKSTFLSLSRVTGEAWRMEL